MYEFSRFAQAFDGKQSKEMLRLVYGALTRARDHCYWIAKPKPNGALSRLGYEREHMQAGQAE